MIQFLLILFPKSLSLDSLKFEWDRCCRASRWYWKFHSRDLSSWLKCARYGMGSFFFGGRKDLELKGAVNANAVNGDLNVLTWTRRRRVFWTFYCCFYLSIKVFTYKTQETVCYAYTLYVSILGVFLCSFSFQKCCHKLRHVCNWPGNCHLLGWEALRMKYPMQ